MAYGVGLDLSGEAGISLDATQLVGALVDTLRADHPTRRFTFLVDALDEARPGHPKGIGSRLLKPLAALPHVRIIVGVRRDPDGGVLPETEDRHARLRALFGNQVIIHDLADEQDTKQDMMNYVRKRLGDSRHKKKTAQIKAVANAIAERADGIFLYSRLVTRTLMDLERLDGPLPDSALEAFVADLTVRFNENITRVHDLLRALAWGQGKGLSRRVWAPIASALSPEGAMYDDQDISWALTHAGAHIVESGENGQAVYRLAHQAFADYFQSQHEPVLAQRLITAAVTEGVGGANWLGVDDYLARHVATHAAAAGKLHQLLVDPGYLAMADPGGLLLALPTITDEPARKIADVYRRVATTLQDADPIERMAVIHLTACKEEPELAPDLEPPVQTAWRCRWARGWKSFPHLVLGDHEYEVLAVAWGTIEGEPVVVSVSGNGSVRQWHARTGEACGMPLRGRGGGRGMGHN